MLRQFWESSGFAKTANAQTLKLNEASHSCKPARSLHLEPYTQSPTRIGQLGTLLRVLRPLGAWVQPSVTAFRLSLPCHFDKEDDGPREIWGLGLEHHP